MPYCMTTGCPPEIAKLARADSKVNAVHGKPVVRCPNKHSSWPPSHDKPTGHGQYRATPWKDVPADWLTWGATSAQADDHFQRRCRAEILRRWEVRAGCEYVDRPKQAEGK